MTEHQNSRQESPIERRRRNLPHPISDERYRNASLSKITDLTIEQGEKINSWLQKPTNFLFIHSGFGRGKTYIGAAIANRRWERALHSYYFNEYEIFKRLEAMKRENQNPTWYLDELGGNRYGCCNSFMIWDDFASTISGADNSFEDAWKINLMKHFIDLRYNQEDQAATVITSNYSIEELGDLVDGRVASRLGASENLIIELFGPDKRTQGM